MKIIIILTSLLSLFYGAEPQKDLVTSKYSCIPKTVIEGRCTGSSSCSVCKNCSRCAHCSNGGTCGVCSGSSTQNFYTTPRQSSSQSSGNSYRSTVTVNVIQNYYAGKLLYVSNATLNLRKGPGTDYEIVEVLSQGDELTFIKAEGEWLKVLVNDSENIGWVHYQYVK